MVKVHIITSGTQLSPQSEETYTLDTPELEEGAFTMWKATMEAAGATVQIEPPLMPHYSRKALAYRKGPAEPFGKLVASYYSW